MYILSDNPCLELYNFYDGKNACTHGHPWCNGSCASFQQHLPTSVITFLLEYQGGKGCCLQFSSVEEAVATRNAVCNLQWPPNGGKLLVAEFVDPQEVKQHVEAPPQSPAPISPSSVTSKASSFDQPLASQPSRLHTLRQQLPPQPTLPPPPPTSDTPVRERLLAPPPLKKPEQTVVTLDDLFKKTKASPRIYYLPLSEDHVAAKLAAQGKSIREQ